MMTSLERTCAVLNGEPVDRVPVFAFSNISGAKTLGYLWNDVRFDPKACADITLKYTEMTRSDFMSLMTVESSAMFMDIPGVDVKLPEDNYGNVMDHIYIEPEDIDSKTLYDPLDPKGSKWLRAGITDKIKMVVDLKPDYLTFGWSWGVMTTAGFLRGVESLMMDLITEPDVAMRILKNASELVDGIMRVSLENGCDFCQVPDPTGSGSLLSMDLFKEFNNPYFKRLIDSWKKDYDAPTSLHVCGDSVPVMDAFRELGINMLSVDFVTDMGTIVENLGNDMAIMGNIDPMSVLWNGTPDLIIEESKKCIDIGRKGKGFVLGPGCEVPRDTPLENVIAMAKAAEMYGKY